MTITVKWEPETQALINASELEVRPENINVAVRQWLRQILNHRKYLEKIRSDPALDRAFKAKAKIYKRAYTKHGAQKNRPEKPKDPRKIFAEKFPERMAKAEKKEPLDVSKKDVIYLGPL